MSYIAQDGGNDTADEWIFREDVEPQKHPHAPPVTNNGRANDEGADKTIEDTEEEVAVGMLPLQGSTRPRDTAPHIAVIVAIN